MTDSISAALRRTTGAFALAVLLLAVLASARASALKTVECQHPVMTGVEVLKLHRISSSRACPVALALFAWENRDDNGAKLYGCHGIGHPFLRMHNFEGWRLALNPYFVMSRGGASFAVSGTDFPISCT